MGRLFDEMKMPAVGLVVVVLGGGSLFVIRTIVLQFGWQDFFNIFFSGTQLLATESY